MDRIGSIALSMHFPDVIHHIQCVPINSVCAAVFATLEIPDPQSVYTIDDDDGLQKPINLGSDRSRSFLASFLPHSNPW